MKYNSKNYKLGSLIKFIIVGLSSNLFLYFIYLFFVNLGLDYKIAVSIIYIVGILYTYAINSVWTFGCNGDHRVLLIKYIFLYFFFYIINLSLLAILVDRMSLAHELVQGGLIFLISMLNFSIQKYWIFKTRS